MIFGSRIYYNILGHGNKHPYQLLKCFAQILVLVNRIEHRAKTSPTREVIKRVGHSFSGIPRYRIVRLSLESWNLGLHFYCGAPSLLTPGSAACLHPFPSGAQHHPGVEHEDCHLEPLGLDVAFPTKLVWQFALTGSCRGCVRKLPCWKWHFE